MAFLSVVTMVADQYGAAYHSKVATTNSLIVAHRGMATLWEAGPGSVFLLPESAVCEK